MTDDVRAGIREGNVRAWDLMLSDPEAAWRLSTALRSEADAAGYAEGLAEAELNIGWCEHYLARHGPALGHFQKSLELFESLGDSLGVMKALNAIGVIHHDLGRFDMAMDYYTRSLEEARRKGNTLREAITLNNIGEICLARGDVKEGLDYFLRAYETMTEIEDPELVANVLINIGTSFHSMENWNLAGDFTAKALEVAKASGDRHIEAQAELGLGRIAMESEDHAKAEAHFLRALELTEAVKNERLRVSVLLDLGSLDAERGDLEGALERYRNALAGAEMLGTKAGLREAYERLSEAHEALGEFRTALTYYKRSARFEREAQNEDTSRKIKNITVQYEVERSRHEAELHRLRNIELREKTESLEELNRQLLSISDLGRRITSSLDLDTVISTLLESLKRHMDTSVFGIAVYIEEERSLDWKGYFINGKRTHRPVKKLDPRRSFAAWSISYRKPVFTNDMEAEFHLYLEGKPTVVGKATHSLVFIPLTIEERAIGILTVQSFEKNAYSLQQRVLLEALAPYVAIAIENGQIHDRLAVLNRAILGEKAELEQAATRTSHLANHDSLTGLPNRRLLFELLQKSFDIAARNGTKVGILFLDLDDFKPVNDRFGHLAGDSVLQEIARRLEDSMRSSDTVARVGGDEFVVVLTNVHGRPDLDLAGSKLEEAVSRPFAIGGETYAVGLSMGAAVFPDDGTSREELLGRADAAMYSSKTEKRRVAAIRQAEAAEGAQGAAERKGRGDRR